MKQRQGAAAVLFLAPNLAGFLTFSLLPLGAALALSFFRWDLFHSPRFVGFENFRRLLGGTFVDGSFQWSDPRFWKYLGNTLVFMLAIPISVALSLGVAILLNQKLRGRTLFRTILFLPTVCAGVGLLLLWKLLLNPDHGLINTLLATIGIKGPGWLQSYYAAKPGIMLMGIWLAMGGTNMILYLAGLQGIPPELYEAAQIDGAGSTKQFWHVTLPLLRPTTFFVLVTSIIGGFQGEFDAAYVMTRGGPDGATTTMSYYIYRRAFEWFDMGSASAMATVLFVLVLGVTLIYWRLSGMRSQYV